MALLSVGGIGCHSCGCVLLKLATGGWENGNVGFARWLAAVGETKAHASRRGTIVIRDKGFDTSHT